jgi:hypothetical protein
MFIKDHSDGEGLGCRTVQGGREGGEKDMVHRMLLQEDTMHRFLFGTSCIPYELFAEIICKGSMGQQECVVSSYSHSYFSIFLWCGLSHIRTHEPKTVTFT